MTDDDISEAPPPDSRVMPAGANRTRLVLSSFLGAAVLILYAPLSLFPFVQDDWVMIHSFMFRSVPSILHDIVDPGGKFFYRPLESLYCWIVYSAFDLQPAGFHLLALFFIALTSFLVVSLAQTVTGDERIAWGSGFLYAAASNIHLDPQMWLVGIVDIGAGLFVLLSLRSYMGRRYAVSAIWFGIALGFKEGTAMLLFVLGAWTLLNTRRRAGAKQALADVWRNVKWHCIPFLALAGAKSAGVSVFSLPPTDPYAARLVGTHITANFKLFALAGLQAVTPLKGVVFSEYAGLMTLFVLTAALVLVFIAGIRYLGRPVSGSGRGIGVFLFILVWFLLMLYPSLTLENHFSKYYLTAALPPLVIGTMLVLKIALLAAGRGGRFILVAMAVFVAANVIDGTMVLYRRVGLGVMDGVHASGKDGDNHLIRKASQVREVWKPLLALIPSLPPHSLLVLENVQTGCFAGKYGFQVLYGDSTLRVTDAVPAGPDSLGMLSWPGAAEGPRGDAGVMSFPLSHTVHVRRVPGGIELVRNGYRLE